MQQCRCKGAGNDCLCQRISGALRRAFFGSCEGNLVMSDWRGGWHCASVQKRLERYFKGPFVEGTSPVIEEAQKELAEYFEGKRRTFDLPLAFAGTDFQKSVWQALQKIGYGETVSYGELARRIGRPKAVRAVGVAVGENPFSIIVPCHRIVGADGSLTGYGGGFEAKKFLLGLESGVH